MTNPPSPNEALRDARQRLNEYEQMQDAQSQCAPCKLCGGSAIISDAGPGAGYYIKCGNHVNFRSSTGCMIDGCRLGGWAYNVMDWWNRLHSQPSPVSPTAGEAREDRVLLLTSYCGGDTEGCTDKRPCDDCLAMCNVCITHGTIDPIGGLDYLRDYPGVETHHRATRAYLSPLSGEPESELFGYDEKGRPQYRFKGAGDVLAAALSGEPASVVGEAGFTHADELLAAFIMDDCTLSLEEAATAVARHRVRSALSKPTPVEAGLREAHRRLRAVVLNDAGQTLAEAMMDGLETDSGDDFAGTLYQACDRLVLAALSETPPPPSQEGGDGHD